MVLRALIPLILLALTFCQSASAQSGPKTWPNDASGRPAPPCTIVNAATGKVEFCDSNTGIPVSLRGTSADPDTDASAYGKIIYGGTGARGSFGYLDTISTRASGPYFQLDDTHYVAVLTSDTDANADVYFTNDGGASWGYPTTIALGAISGAGQGGVASTEAYYVVGGAGFLMWRTTDFLTYSSIDFTGVGSTAFGGITRTQNNLVATGRGTSGADVGHLCKSDDLNPTTIGDWTCQEVPPGGAGTNVGKLFVKQQSVAYVPGTTGTVLAIDSPSLSNVANIYRSTDDGASWSFIVTLVAQGRDTTLDNNPGNSVACQATTTGSVCYAATGSRVYKSTDAGLTWTQMLSDATADLYGIVLFPDQPDYALVLRAGCGGSPGNMAMRTIDAGETWLPIQMERCTVTSPGRGYVSIHSTSTGGRFLASLTSQAPFVAFSAAVYGAPSTTGTPFGENKVSFYSRGRHVGEKPTYTAALNVETATAAGTGPFFSLCGSATKTIRIKSLEINGSVATAATRSSVVVRKTSTATSGGTATALTAVAHDTQSAASTATVLNFYTVLATPGTAVGPVGIKFRVLPITGTVAATDYMEPYLFLFNGLDVEPVTLRATTQCIEASFGATTTNAPTLTVRVTWTED